MVQTHAMVVIVAVHNQGVVVEEYPEREHEMVTREAPDGHGGELRGVGIGGMVHVVLPVGSSHVRRLPDRGKDTVRRVAGQTVEFEEDVREDNDNNAEEDVDIDCSVMEDIEDGDGGGERGVNEQVDAHMAMVDTENDGLRRMDRNGSSLATENASGCLRDLRLGRWILWGQICSSDGKE